MFVALVWYPFWSYHILLLFLAMDHVVVFALKMNDDRAQMVIRNHALLQMVTGAHSLSDTKPFATGVTVLYVWDIHTI